MIFPAALLCILVSTTLDIQITEARRGAHHANSLGIFVGDDWRLAKGLGGGVKVVIGAARRQGLADIQRIREIIGDPRNHDLRLGGVPYLSRLQFLHDPGQAKQTQILVKLIRRSYDTDATHHGQ